MEKIEYLISTMNRENIDFLDSMNIEDDVVIVNQATTNKEEIIYKGKQKIHFITVDEKGLSKSRNMAIENSQADICVLADDDFKYYDNVSEQIMKAYKKYPNADIIAFYYKSMGRQKKKFDGKSKKVNFISSLKICSAQITFKRAALKKYNIQFNEMFGAGATKYKSGEENILLFDCLKKGMNIYVEPIYILELEEGNTSSWFSGYNKEFLETKGAVYYEMTKWWYWILILQFAVRKRNLYGQSGISIIDAIRYMFKARRKYKKEVKKDIYMFGDFISDTGPSIVNKNYSKYIEKRVYIGNYKGKLKRIVDLILHINYCSVVVISGLSKLQLLACKIAKRYNKKVIYLMHGYTKKEYEANEVPLEQRNLEKMENIMLMKADKIVCVSENFSKMLRDERKDLQHKITFVNNGVELINVENKNNYKSNADYTIISVGGGMKRKGNLNICRAIEKIDNIGIKFIVIGSKDKDGDEIEKYKFVQYYEKLGHNEVLNKMKKADLYVQNSKFETFGLAIFEAISKGCKILVSKQVGALSVIDNINQNSIINNTENILEIEEKIRLAYKNKNEYVKYINNYNKYTWSKSAKKLLEICDGDETNEK